MAIRNSGHPQRPATVDEQTQVAHAPPQVVHEPTLGPWDASGPGNQPQAYVDAFRAEGVLLSDSASVVAPSGVGSLAIGPAAPVGVPAAGGGLLAANLGALSGGVSAEIFGAFPGGVVGGAIGSFAGLVSSPVVNGMRNETLSNGAEWHLVPDGSVTLIDAGRNVAIGAGAGAFAGAVTGYATVKAVRALKNSGCTIL